MEIYVVIEQLNGLVQNVKVYENREFAEMEALRALKEECSCGRCFIQWQGDYGDLTCKNGSVSVFDRPVHQANGIAKKVSG